MSVSPIVGISANSTTTMRAIKSTADASESTIVAGDPESPGITYDPSHSGTFVFGKNPEEQAAFDYSVQLYHRAIPVLDGNTAINTIEKQLARIDKVIAKQRPSLEKNSWDVTVEKGKLKVTGSASAEDKKWLEHKVNSDGLLTTAVGSYMKAAVDYLETTDENPPYFMQMGSVYSHSQVYNFKDVAKQLEGTISFRELSATSWKGYLNPRTGEYGVPGVQRGGDTFEILASRLKVEQSK